MSLTRELLNVKNIFIDTAPIIYYIEAHALFGPLAEEVVTAFQSGPLSAFTSAITLTEVLSKPFEAGDAKLAARFAGFLKNGRHLSLVEISAKTPEECGGITRS